MLVHAVSDGYLFGELLPAERHRVCMLLGLEESDLAQCFVTFLRRALTDEDRHKRLEHSQRELAEYADVLAASKDDLWSVEDA